VKVERLWVIATGIVVLAAACGNVIDRAPGSSGGWSVLYWTPSTAGSSVGTLYLRESSQLANSPTPDVMLGPGNDVSPLQTHSYAQPPYRRALIGVDGTGTIHDVGASAAELTTSWSWSESAVGPALMDQAGSIFEARGGLQIVATHRDGSSVTYHLPSAADGEPTIDGKPIKAPRGGSAVRAFAPGSNGQVFAFVSNGVNSLVVELNTNRQGSLPGFGVILDSATSADGQLEALAYDPRSTTNHIVLLGLDPTSLTVVQTVDTGINPRSPDAHLHTHLIVATRSGLFVYIVLQSLPPTVQDTSRLFEIPTGATFAKTIPVTGSTGLTISEGSDGHLYLYDGPARNQVFVIDPSSGLTTPNAILATPPGSFVRAVFN